MAKEKESKLANTVNARPANIVESKIKEDSAVELPEGFEGGKEVSSFAPVAEFSAPGDYVAGFYIGSKDEVGPNASKLYLIELPRTKETVAIWGSTILDSKIMSSGIRPGDKILIQRLEDIPSKKKGQSPAKNFRVMVN